MAWEHRKLHGYNEWRYESSRDFFGNRKMVYATAIVTSYGGSEDSTANWEVMRNGSPVARGYSSTVAAAKKAAFRAMWKPGAGRKRPTRNYGRS